MKTKTKQKKSFRIANVNLSSCAEIHFLWLGLARNVMDIEKNLEISVVSINLSSYVHLKNILLVENSLKMI